MKIIGAAYNFCVLSFVFSELFLSLEGQDLERVLNQIEETADVNDNDINLLKSEDFNVSQFTGAVFHNHWFLISVHVWNPHGCSKLPKNSP